MADLRTRFLVEWTPTADVKRACAVKGMRAGDKTSFWDWIDPEHCTKQRTFVTFDSAVKFARSMSPVDAFGMGRVTRQIEVDILDEDDEPTGETKWDDDALWEIGLGREPHADRPDQRFDEAA